MASSEIVGGDGEITGGSWAPPASPLVVAAGETTVEGWIGSALCETTSLDADAHSFPLRESFLVDLFSVGRKVLF